MAFHVSFEERFVNSSRMHFTKLHLKNWRNFVSVDIPKIGERLFITGPNASGKSNLLDVFRFLRDIAKTGGGLQQAVKERGGLPKIRCLAARNNPNVEIDVALVEVGSGENATWRYNIGLQQEPRGARRTLLTRERVWRNDKLILDRPDDQDAADLWRLTETHLEQISVNLEFRSLADAFQKTVYLHLVPQLLKFPSLANRDTLNEDPFGLKFLERVMEAPTNVRKSRLKKIEEALRIAVPELANLTEIRDDKGIPHLEAVYQHWRPNAGRQREDQFSDGTIRLIGLLWALLDGDALLLLEEPELQLHSKIVETLPALIWRMQRPKRRQVIVSSHSAELFSDKGIRPSEVALLRPRGKEGTLVELASEKNDIRDLLAGGMSMAEAVLPLTAPDRIQQLSLFE
jgi:predicted ATPase